MPTITGTHYICVINCLWIAEKGDELSKILNEYLGPFEVFDFRFICFVFRFQNCKIR